MAIQALALDPTKQYPVSADSDRSPVQDYDPDNITDPKLRLQKALIEKMFGDEEKEDGAGSLNPHISHPHF